KLGALLSGRDEEVIEAFNSFGTKLGIAMQIGEDIRQVWESDNDSTAPHNEVLNKKKLLPIVYSIQTAEVREKRRLGEIFMKRVLEPTDITTVRSILDELDARRYSESLAEDYRSQAVNDLTTLSIIHKKDKSIDQLTSILTKSMPI
ncbi:MAG: polyprenyl synthetase family protein, partial [SAR202 cluster bacterium]|nr:polyprenyl synthetase family protein [SAR202 cluster bacterium]